MPKRQQRTVFGIPAPPPQYYTVRLGCLIADKERNDAADKRWGLAMSACRLIAGDRGHG